MRILCEWFTVFVLHIIRFHEIFHIENGAKPQLPSSKSRERKKINQRKCALLLFISIYPSLCLFSAVRFAIGFSHLFVSNAMPSQCTDVSPLYSQFKIFFPQLARVCLCLFVKFSCMCMCVFFCSFFFCTIIANEILFVYSGKLFNFNDSSRLCHTKGNK